MPAMQDAYLFILPQKHYLNYGSCLLREIIAKNRQPGQLIVELVGDDANATRVSEELERVNPIAFSGIGHGNTDTFTVECTEHFVSAESPKLSLFKDKIVDLCSCLTAQQLGPAIMNAGALTYLGYKQEFWFYVGDDPCTTRAVRSPFIAAFCFIEELLKGNATGKARELQLQRFEDEINYWTTGEGKNHADAMDLARISEMNKINSVFLGDAGTTPSPTVPVAGEIKVPLPIIFGVPIIAIALILKYYA